jgi:hypothetical protein
MDYWPRRFARMSLIYLVLGATIGAHMGFADAGYTQVRFAHVHFMLTGFMAMMIYAVGYHVLPRFNAVPIPYPRLVPLHFWLANVGLIGMVTLYALGAFFGKGAPRVAFGLFGGMEAVSILLFVTNLFPTLRDPRPAPEASAPSSSTPPPPASAPAPETPQVRLKADMTVAELLDTWPHLGRVLDEMGLANLTDISVRQTAAKMVTMTMAAKRAGIGLGEMISTLEGTKLLVGEAAPAHPDHYLPQEGGAIVRGERATAKTQIGALLAIYPEVRPVFSARYGEACFTCPGQKTETVEQTAMMHGQPVAETLAAINEAIDRAEG